MNAQINVIAWKKKIETQKSRDREFRYEVKIKIK